MIAAADDVAGRAPLPTCFSGNAKKQVMEVKASQLIVAAHGFATGTRVAYDINGQTGVQTSAGAALETSSIYIRKIDANTVELYDTELHAYTTWQVAGRQDFTAVTTGTYGKLVRTCVPF